MDRRRRIANEAAAVVEVRSATVVATRIDVTGDRMRVVATKPSAILAVSAGTVHRTAPRLVVSAPPRTPSGEEPRPMAEPTVRQIDQQLVERAQRGDKKAFEMLV